MNFVKENVSRKIDSLGRISIPKGIRDRFEWGANDEVEFAVCYDGFDSWICMRKVVDISKAEMVAMELEALGVEVPEQLKTLIDGN